MRRRVYVVGTDTGVGKTAVTCALILAGRRRGLRVLPFKPAASGPDDGPMSDPARLLRAASLSDDALDLVCPLRYEPPLAPGIAEQSHAFVTAGVRPQDEPLGQAARALDELERLHRPDIVLIEGAGGLHVPMPGATWQPTWIQRLSEHVIVVGRAGLGTISHTLLTIDALQAIGRAPAAFALSTVGANVDASRSDNARVIHTARGVPHLGTLPHLDAPDAHADSAWLADDAWPLLGVAG